MRNSLITVAGAGINYIRARVYAALFYEKKYLTGKWFKGKYGGVFSSGWKWVLKDAKGSLALGNIKQAPWPVNPLTSIVHYSNITFDVDDLNIFQNPGCYYQAHGKITIGKGTWIAPNVGLITSNHDLSDLEKHMPPREINIGRNCWIGMNSMVLPGVVIGDNTVVGAGSVVTKSFPLGHCVIAGNPARIIKELPDGEGRK